MIKPGTKAGALAKLATVFAPITHAIGISDMLGAAVRWRSFYAGALADYRYLTQQLAEFLPFAISQTAINVFIIYMALVSGVYLRKMHADVIRGGPPPVKEPTTPGPGRGGIIFAEKIFANGFTRFLLLFLIPLLLPLLLLAALGVSWVSSRENKKLGISPKRPFMEEAFDIVWSLSSMYLQLAFYGLLSFLVCLVFFSDVIIG